MLYGPDPNLSLEFGADRLSSGTSAWTMACYTSPVFEIIIAWDNYVWQRAAVPVRHLLDRNPTRIWVKKIHSIRYKNYMA